MNKPTNKLSMEDLTSYAKRRGFVFQSSELYGGIAGFWDLGPYGAELADNIKSSWWKYFVHRNINVVGINTTIIQNPKLWKASGHIDTFVDPMVDCRECKHRFRADHTAGVDTNDLKKLDSILEGIVCANCDAKNSFTPAKTFQMMFKTYVGPIQDDNNIAYLRPETAGGIFAQFDNVRQTTRQKLPFGIAQIGKAFRNEITPGDFIFRLRELTQMELEIFTHPKEAGKWYKYWKQDSMKWVESLGIAKQNLQYHEHNNDERAHYAKESVDIEYKYPFGFKELYGIANRSDYDLSAHSKQSGKDLSYYDEESGERFTPHVIEPSVGVERLLMAVMLDAYDEEEVNGEKRVVMRFKNHIAPVKVAILPLSKKPELSRLGGDVFAGIAGDYNIEYDETQSIGRRYRRQDEIGTPYCVTVDFESLKDKAVTIRDRDSMKQERIKIADLKEYLESKLR